MTQLSHGESVDQTKNNDFQPFGSAVAKEARRSIDIKKSLKQSHSEP
jgi:hypothetical protein